MENVLEQDTEPLSALDEAGWCCVRVCACVCVCVCECAGAGEHKALWMKMFYKCTLLCAVQIGRV